MYDLKVNVLKTCIKFDTHTSLILKGGCSLNKFETLKNLTCSIILKQNTWEYLYFTFYHDDMTWGGL